MAYEERRVKVAVAVRSLSEKERTYNDEYVVGTQGNEVKVLNPETRREKLFKFDYTVSYFCKGPDIFVAYLKFRVRLRVWLGLALCL